MLSALEVFYVSAPKHYRFAECGPIQIRVFERTVALDRSCADK
jgi:hypothetical protein